MLLANFLRTLRTRVNLCGQDNPTVVHVINAAKENKISEVQLLMVMKMMKMMMVMKMTMMMMVMMRMLTV